MAKTAIYLYRGKVMVWVAQYHANKMGYPHCQRDGITGRWVRRWHNG